MHWFLADQNFFPSGYYTHWQPLPDPPTAPQPKGAEGELGRVLEMDGVGTMTEFSREFSMGNGETFSLPPVARLLDRWLQDATVVIDPFARNSTRGTLTNDLNPATTAQYHMDAVEFVAGLTGEADAVLFDPPYSPRQVKELYQQIGKQCSKVDTQQAYRALKDMLTALLVPGGIAISCGWNSTGFGKTRGFDLLEVLLVHHGGNHNDTIVTVERKGGRP